MALRRTEDIALSSRTINADQPFEHCGPDDDEPAASGSAFPRHRSACRLIKGRAAIITSVVQASD